jgi:pyruvate dehydrogenase E1 component alpha subunit
VARAQQHDPIVVFGTTLQERGMATASTLQEIARNVTAAVEEAIAFAKASPLPRPEDALLEVFAP